MPHWGLTLQFSDSAGGACEGSFSRPTATDRQSRTSALPAPPLSTARPRLAPSAGATGPARPCPRPHGNPRPGGRPLLLAIRFPGTPAVATRLQPDRDAANSESRCRNSAGNRELLELALHVAQDRRPGLHSARQRTGCRRKCLTSKRLRLKVWHCAVPTGSIPAGTASRARSTGSSPQPSAFESAWSRASLAAPGSVEWCEPCVNSETDQDPPAQWLESPGARFATQLTGRFAINRTGQARSPATVDRITDMPPEPPTSERPPLSIRDHRTVENRMRHICGTLLDDDKRGARMGVPAMRPVGGVDLAVSIFRLLRISDLPRFTGHRRCGPAATAFLAEACARRATPLASRK